MLYIEEFEYRSEANRFDSDFVFKKTKKSELSFFLKTKGKKRKGSLVNYRSFAITSPTRLGTKGREGNTRLRVRGRGSQFGRTTGEKARHFVYSVM
jgi:hypothetical protein